MMCLETAKQNPDTGHNNQAEKQETSPAVSAAKMTTHDKVMMCLETAKQNPDTGHNNQAEEQETSPAVPAKKMDSMGENNTKPLLPVTARKDGKEDLIEMMKKLILMQALTTERIDLLEKKKPTNEEHMTKLGESPEVQGVSLYMTDFKKSANAVTERNTRADDRVIENPSPDQVRRRRSYSPVDQPRSRKHDDFVRQPVENQPVIEVPGIGRALAKNLKFAGYSKARQLLDEFVDMEEDKVKFRKWLHEVCGANLEQFADCYNGLREWRRNNDYRKS